MSMLYFWTKEKNSKVKYGWQFLVIAEMSSVLFDTMTIATSINPRQKSIVSA